MSKSIQRPPLQDFATLSEHSKQIADLENDMSSLKLWQGEVNDFMVKVSEDNQERDSNVLNIGEQLQKSQEQLQAVMASIRSRRNEALKYIAVGLFFGLVTYLATSRW